MRLSTGLVGGAILALALGIGATLPASADWRDEVKTLRMGILANGDAPYRTTVIEPFRAYLQERLGLPVEVVPVGTYAELIDAQAGARVQYAIHSATSYATALERCACVQAIAAPIAAGGALGFYSVLITRAGDPIRTLGDARGKRLAISGEDSVAGRLVPMKAFADEDIEPEEYFSEIVEAASPAAAVKALLYGDVDVAVGWSSMTGLAGTGYDFGLLKRMVADGTLTMDQVRVIWQSRLIPFGPHVVRSDVPGELKAALRDALTSMAAENEAALDAVDRLSFGGGGFASPDPEIYAVVRELVAPPATSP